MNSISKLIQANWHSRSLIKQLIMREVAARYKGSILGMFWSFFVPLSLLAVYTLVFMGIFGAKWPGMEDKGGLEFALQIFTGLSVFNIFGEMIQRAPNLLSENPNLIKKVVFPSETLVSVAIGSTMVGYVINLGILLVALTFAGMPPSLQILMLPVFLAPLVLLVIGISLLLSSLGLFIKDLRLVIGSLITLLLFVSPVFFAIESVKEPWRTWLSLNPLATIISNIRNLIFFPQQLDWLGCSQSYLIALLMLMVGASVFQRLKPGFADVV